jgi:hypothetical protein
MMVEDVKRTPVRPKRRRNNFLYFTSKKERFKPSVRKKNANKEGKIKMLNSIEQTVKTLDFYTITTMAMKDDEGAKNK